MPNAHIRCLHIKIDILCKIFIQPRKGETNGVRPVHRCVLDNFDRKSKRNTSCTQVYFNRTSVFWSWAMSRLSPSHFVALFISLRSFLVYAVVLCIIFSFFLLAFVVSVFICLLPHQLYCIYTHTHIHMRECPVCLSVCPTVCGCLASTV